MTLPYLLRLWCLCLASFFLLHLALGLAVSLVAPYAIRESALWKARVAARLLFTLRMFPGGLAALLVAAICAPSYLWLEPAAGSEGVGWGCLLAAVLGLAVLLGSAGRGLCAWRRSNRYIRECDGRSQTTLLGVGQTPVSVVDGPSPAVALAGILRPRLLMSRRVIRVLSAEQLAAVVRHERAHRISRDNLKRLLMVLTPSPIPFLRSFGALERAWALAAEWAADEDASAGDRQGALTLASALVRVARLNLPQPGPLLAPSFLANGADLSSRIDRLLQPASPCELTERSPILRAAASLTLAAGMAGVMLQPATFHSVHDLLEDLIR